jgi:hypothetical protein
MKKIVLILAGVAVVALLTAPFSAAGTTDLGSPTGLTSDEIEALGLPWDASLEVWTTAVDPPNAQCVGTLPPGTYENITVPPGATCALNNTHTITHDLTILDGASLRDDGAHIGHDIRAKNPLWINITDALFNVAAGTVGHDIHIQGTTGQSPSHGGDNFICDQQVGHDVVVQKSLITAGRWVIGDDDDPAFYGGCGNSIAHDLVAKDNANRLDISGNSPGGGLNNVSGIGHDLKVEHNHGGTVVQRNTAGHDCHQSDNSPYVGAANVAGNDNNCNAVY